MLIKIAVGDGYHHSGSVTGFLQREGTWFAGDDATTGFSWGKRDTKGSRRVQRGQIERTGKSKSRLPYALMSATDICRNRRAIRCQYCILPLIAWQGLRTLCRLE